MTCVLFSNSLPTASGVRVFLPSGVSANSSRSVSKSLRVLNVEVVSTSTPTITKFQTMAVAPSFAVTEKEPVLSVCTWASKSPVVCLGSISGTAPWLWFGVTSQVTN